MDEFVKGLSKKYSLDRRVVAEIVNHPIRFTRHVMAGDSDRPIRIRYFGVFYQQPNKTKLLYSHERVNTILLSEQSISDFARVMEMDVNDVKPILEELLLQKKYNKIMEVYSKYYGVIKKIVKAPKLTTTNKSKRKKEKAL